MDSDVTGKYGVCQPKPIQLDGEQCFPSDSGIFILYLGFDFQEYFEDLGR